MHPLPPSTIVLKDIGGSVEKLKGGSRFSFARWR
jgi:hypothetical protein